MSHAMVPNAIVPLVTALFAILPSAMQPNAVFYYASNHLLVPLL